MNQPMVWMTAPALSDEDALWFSAYGFGWGYRTFSISCDVLRDSLGAHGSTREQMRDSLSAWKPQLLEAVLRHGSSVYEGERIRLEFASISSINGELRCVDENS
ncbi:hypothetical protein [Paraburkholderia rhizosphaerae]|uniref:Uncharacterized protein n=1 Tax=Paraburkholderia rhizosphaerae TaxID=480658 RepID=A0A4V3HFD7_9BURK|nr:hypothetical protein [Paraburkholderia rhizosphaerae]TDY52738.1 hypothetical protein BX592_10420 [Paraburkholderia rhizosphaerae]